MKYPVIYAALNERRAKIVGFHVSDYSGWQAAQQTYISRCRPLWIVVEDPGINKRIWITQDGRDLSISTAQLDLPIDTPAYHRSHRRRGGFRSQKAMLAYLNALFTTGEFPFSVKEEETNAG
jgi:hypothetical protein